MPLVPYAIEVPDRIPKQRYYDPEFFALEASSSGRGSGRWPAGSRRSRTSTTSPSTRSSTSRCSSCAPPTAAREAFQNACRHRGVRVAHRAAGSCEQRLHLPVPRLVLRPRRQEHLRPAVADVLRAQPAARRHRPHRPCSARCGAAARGSTSTRRPRRCASASSRSPPSWTRGSSSRCGPSGGTPARLPVNWKAAEEAFVEQYHVLEAHPQLRLPGRYPAKDGSLDPPAFIEGRAQLPPLDEPRAWPAWSTPTT